MLILPLIMKITAFKSFEDIDFEAPGVQVFVLIAPVCRGVRLLLGTEALAGPPLWFGTL